ncbi:MAG: hypothetical protein ACK59C_04575 [Holosporales bacterium]|jgi:hypothetical protein
MFDWLFRAVNKLLEDHPSEEEKDFWSLFEQNMARGPYFVPFAKLLEKFDFKQLFKICTKLERQGKVYIDRYGIYTTKKGDAVLKRLNPSNSLPNTIGVSGSGVSGRTTEQLPAERITKRLPDGGRITKRLPENGRNTTKVN